MLRQLLCSVRCRTLQRLRTTAVQEQRRLAATGGSGYEKMVVFDRELKRRQQNFAASQPNSKDFEFLRTEVSQRLVDRLLDIGPQRQFGRALDLGGYLSEELLRVFAERGANTIVQAGSVEALLRRPRESSVRPLRVVCDEERLPFGYGAFDLVVSSLALHWTNDLPGVFRQIRDLLRPDGVFLAALYGQDTLHELRTAFAMAEQEREGGISPHASPLVGVGDVGGLLGHAGFALPTVDVDRLVVGYSSMFELMHDLQGMGDSHAALARRERVPRSTVAAAAAAYQSLFADPQTGAVPATFQIVYLIGWAPHASQQRPKERGSQQFSLADLGVEGATPLTS